jgi:uncharacterized protein YegP (UPF0339 family)
MKLHLYKTTTGWRWNVKSKNGNVIANGGQGYSRKIDAKRALRAFMEHSSTIIGQSNLK